MKRTTGMMILMAAAAVVIRWNSAAAQYGQDSTMHRQSSETPMRMQVDTSYRRAPSDTGSGIYYNNQDTTMRRNRFQKDTTGTRTWTPSTTRPDTTGTR